MGFEVTLLVGKDTGQVFEGMTYFMITAVLDLGKCTRTNLLLLPWENHTPRIEQWECYAPVGDNDIPIVEDRYGAKMQPLAIDDVVRALEKDIRRDNYRPAEWAVTLLNKIQESAIDNEEFSVMLYGH